MDIRKIPISQIEPARYNPRVDLQPTDSEYIKLAKGLAEFGLVEPLVWNEFNGRLISGHQRLKILIAAKQTEVEVSVVSISEDHREKALNIALNKLGGSWDNAKLKDLLEEIDTGLIELELTGFDEDEVERLMSQFHAPDFQPVGENEQGRLDEKSKVTCPECGHSFSPS